MYSWLKPGGRLYLVADTPYGIWRKLIPIFEQKKEKGERWPGLMIGLENYLPIRAERPSDRRAAVHESSGPGSVDPDL